MGYEMTGTIKVIMEPQTFQSGFSKREFVLTVEDGKYPQDIAFECVKDRMALLDGISTGDAVTVSFDIRGREYNGRYFNNLNAWKITTAGAGAGAAGRQDAASLPDDSENPALDEDRDGYEDPF
jgi:hypothetical protein